MREFYDMLEKATRNELDEKGYVKTDGTRTNIEGIFVAGDIWDYRYRQAVTAAGSGCEAAIDAEKC